MLRTYLQSIFFLFSFVILLSSCAKEGPTGPAGNTGTTGPAGPKYFGSIKGHIMLYDQYGSKIADSTTFSKVQVALLGNVSQYADKNGFFLFQNDSTGMYVLSVVDSGFGTDSISNIRFINDTLNQDIAMSQIPTYHPDSMYYDTVGGADSLYIRFVTDTRTRECIIFANSDTLVNSHPEGYLLYYTAKINPGQTLVSIYAPSQDFYNVGINSGSSIYFRGYGVAVNDASVYEDLATGKLVWNAVSDSSVFIASQVK